jgi:hypothetical protein
VRLFCVGSGLGVTFFLPMVVLSYWMGVFWSISATVARTVLVKARNCSSVRAGLSTFAWIVFKWTSARVGLGPCSVSLASCSSFIERA